MRYLGKTSVCRAIVQSVGGKSKGSQNSGSSSGNERSVNPAPKECEMIVGSVLAPALPSGDRKAGTKRSATFTDTIPKSIEQADPYGSAVYAVEVLNTDNRGAGLSNSAGVALVPTIAPLDSFSAQATAQGVMISWQCPERSGAIAGVNYLFRIYRRPAEGGPDARIAELNANKCVGRPESESPSIQEEKQAEAGTSFLDQTIVWESTYLYRGTVVSVLATKGGPSVEVEGDDTPKVTVFAHDIFPPAVPTGLQAVFSGPGQQPFIDLIWAPVTDADLAGYNVYRREEGAEPMKLNSGLVATPAFRDMQVVSGKTYFYSVSAVDQRGNESARSAEASETVP